MRHRWLLLVVVLALVSACDGRGPVGRPSEARAHAVPASPDGLTIAADADPAAEAAATSRALFRSSDVAVVVRISDLPGVLAGASAAVALGVPMLVEPETGTATVLDTELDRLGTETVLAVGRARAVPQAPARGKRSRRVVRVAATAAALTAAGVPLRGRRSVARDAVAAGIALLDPGAVQALVPVGGSTADPPTDAPSASTADSASPGKEVSPDRAAKGSVPTVSRGPAPKGALVLATGGTETFAGVATARAAGVPTVLTGGTADPRASSAVVSALGRARPSAVVALGAPFAGEQGLDWKLATATTGRELPGGGQVLFPGRTLVALYGTPGTAALGVLGEQGLEATIDRARAHAASYRPLVGGPVVPTLEIIATVASDSPGPDGNYSTEIDPASLRPWIEAAGRAGLYVVLDLQPGRSDFLAQAEQYQSLLELPNVGLALDPEWRLGPGQLPVQQIGSVGVDEVNRVVTWLADLTRAHQLPQKLLVLHQFRLSMIEGRDRLDTSRSELAVLLHADGQGGQGSKQGTWQALHQDLPPGPLFWGWKNFYDEDQPMLTPEQTVSQVDPTPNLISYQ